MRSIRLGQTTNTDCYLAGNRLVGRIKEFKLDKFGYEKVAHKTLGSVGAVELPSRGVEALKAKIKFEWLETAIMAMVALPNKVVTLQFENYVDIFDAGGLAVDEGYRVITIVDLLFNEEQIDAFKMGNDSVGSEADCSVTRIIIKSTETDQFIREYAPLAGVNRVDGKDVWPSY